MIKKLSEQLQDAYMSGDKDEIITIQSQIDDRKKLIDKKVTVTPITINTVFSNDNSSAIKIYDFLCNSELEQDWWELEIETIQRILWLKYGVVLDDNNLDKVWGIKHLCNSNRPWLDFFNFDIVALSTAGVQADFEILRIPTVGMVLSAIKTMQYIRPEEKFSLEVKKFISIIFIHEGIYMPPPSIIDLIADEFNLLISEDSRKMWPSIYDKYKQTIESKNFNLSEDVIDIQVKRLILSEKAADEYHQ